MLKGYTSVIAVISFLSLISPHLHNQPVNLHEQPGPCEAGLCSLSEVALLYVMLQDFRAFALLGPLAWNVNPSPTWPTASLPTPKDLFNVPGVCKGVVFVCLIATVAILLLFNVLFFFFPFSLFAILLCG